LFIILARPNGSRADVTHLYKKSYKVSLSTSLGSIRVVAVFDNRKAKGQSKFLKKRLLN